MTGSAALEARELYRFFHAGEEEVQALRGVSLTIRAGELVALVGPSGSGKSTLLNCVAGLDDPDGGAVHIAGRMMSRRPERDRAALRARDVGVLTQSGNLMAHLSVAANVSLAARMGRSSTSRARELLVRLGLGDRASSCPAKLSGGETARASLAVSLANQPAVLLADEPTGELDGDTEREVLALLRSVAEEGTAVLVASHSRALAAIADRVVTLSDGRIVDDRRRATA